MATRNAGCPTWRLPLSFWSRCSSSTSTGPGTLWFASLDAAHARSLQENQQRYYWSCHYWWHFSFILCNLVDFEGLCCIIPQFVIDHAVMPSRWQPTMQHCFTLQTVSVYWFVYYQLYSHLSYKHKQFFQGTTVFHNLHCGLAFALGRNGCRTCASAPTSDAL